ncbi:MAG: N-acetylmuramoyl-L-alanine amidase, partial [Anaerolineae bacterium]|nr:N-acetylmuramoyl-L-alanine amidase [Anaerolineae bacterium]
SLPGEPDTAPAASEQAAVPQRTAEPPPLLSLEDEVPAWLRAAPDDNGDASANDAPPWLQAILAEKQRGPRAAAKPLAAADDEAEDDDPESLRQRRQRVRRERDAAARRGGAVGAFQSVLIVLAAAFLVATIFTFWTPASFLSDEARDDLAPAYATLNAQSYATPVPTPIWMRRVGIVSGHWGNNPLFPGVDDPGAVCDDGLTEAEINRSVAQLVVQALSGRGYDVDLLDEWDPRLQGYEASALLSIHADSCYAFEQAGATGFKVAPPASRATGRADDERLTGCLIQHYGEITGLPRHPSITRDMSEYHGFGEIAPLTPAAIIEIGFLYEDREILTTRPDLLAEGIVAGLLCFLENPLPTPLPPVTPWPTALYTPTPLETPNPS